MSGTDAEESAMLQRGDEVIVRCYGGVQARMRVWEDVYPGVLLTSEAEYQRALRESDEARAAGFPKFDIIEIVREPRHS